MVNTMSEFRKLNKLERRRVMKFFAIWFVCLLFAMMLSGCVNAPTIVADKNTVGDNSRNAGKFVSLADISTRK